MKKFLTVLFILFIGLSANAAAKKYNGLSDEQILKMNNTLNCIIKKMHSGAFFSPEDAANMTDIRLKLDDAMLQNSDSRYASLYYKLGRIYQKRGNKEEAVECYQEIAENFMDSALAPKSIIYLKQLGINSFTLPKKDSDE